MTLVDRWKRELIGMELTQKFDRVEPIDQCDMIDFNCPIDEEYNEWLQLYVEE